MNDLRFAFRQLLKNPGFTAVIVFTLALGIGANTAIFSVVNTLLLHPLPGLEPDRLMQIAERNYVTGGSDRGKPFFVGVSGPVLEALRANQDFFSDFAWFDFEHLERKTTDFVEHVPGALVSPNFFRFWNARPLLGRTFAADEATHLNEDFRLAADSVIVLSYSWWKSLFNGDKDVLGRVVELGGRHFTVIGVMPANFQFPQVADARFWLPAEDPRRNDLPNIRVMVCLKPGVTEQQTQAMLDAVANSVKEEHSRNRFLKQEWQRRQGLGLWLRPLSDEFTSSYGSEGLRATLFGLLGAISFLLLIVCANVANLMLAKTERREHEFAVRAALGAGRVRLMRQLLTESVLLACIGGLGGILVTFWGLQVLVSLIPETMPRLKVIQVDGHALGSTLLVSVLSGVAFGLAPGLHARRTRLHEALKQSGLSTTAGTGGKNYRSALIIGEVALTVVLLAGAGLMIQSVVRLLQVNPGFDTENLLRVELSLPWDKYASPEKTTSELRNALLAQLHERLAALPGVKAVGLFKDGAWEEKFKMDGQADSLEVELLRSACGVEESDFFRAMRIPLLAGRYFEKRDIGENAGTTIINETMARLCWPGEEAVGKKFRRPTGDRDDIYEVIGVVADSRFYSYAQRMRPTFYRPYHEFSLEGMRPWFAMRSRGDPRALIPAIRQELKAAEPNMGTPRIHVARQILYDSTQAQRTYMLYLVVFAAIGLLLSALGIYGVLAYSVMRRTREIGIRMAVGAERRHVLRMVISEGARLIGAGVLLGLVAAFWLTQLLRNQLFEVSPSEPAVFAGVVLLLCAVALLACLLPALRAARIDPMKALRYE